MSGTARRRAIIGVELLVVAVIAGLVISGSGGSGHRVFVTVPDATAAVTGQMIRAAGVVAGSVGSIQSVDGGHAARVQLNIDDSAWPLPAGTTMQLRWGGTVSYANGYVELTRGPDGGSVIPDGGTVPAQDFHVPTQFDTLLTTFDAPTRQSLKHFINLGGVTFETARPSLARALEVTPGALRQTSFVANDLAENRSTLDALVRTTDNVVHAVQSANPGAAQLVSGTATTLTALADQASNVQATIADAPGTLAAVRTTLANADPTLKLAALVTGRLAPGIQQARLLAAPLDRVLGTVRSAGPVATTTLRIARKAAPSIDKLLAQLTTTAPLVKSVSGQAAPEVGCIRPYTPEIMALGSGWGDFTSFSDSHDPFIRMTPKVLVPAPTNANTSTAATVVATNPGLKYSYPVPPGYTSGQSWFQPQCGITPDVLNPAHDPAGS
jgi:ABC-type transporter Mla subunit MlaD